MLLSVRHLTAAVSAAAGCRLAASQASHNGLPLDASSCRGRQLDSSFNSTNEAYRSKTNWELVRAMCVLKLCSYDFIVQRNAQLMKLGRRLLGRPLFRMLMKASFYGHFVAGEDQEEIKPKVARMRQFGVKSILDYSVEQDIAKPGDNAVDDGSHSSAQQTSPSSSAAVQHPVDNANLLKELLDTSIYNPPPISKLGSGDDELLWYKMGQSELLGRRMGVISARTYDYAGEPECDHNLEVICSCIEQVSQATDGQGFAAVKLTALGRPQFLLQLSEVIAQTQLFYKVLTGSDWGNLVRARLTEDGFMSKLAELGVQTDHAAVRDWFSQADFDQDGFVDIYKWQRLLDHNLQLSHMFQVLNLRSGRLEPLLSNLSADDERQFVNMMRRLLRVADQAAECGVRVMIDAEQTYFQPAISRLALELMRRYNRQRSVIFTTYQAYLKSALGAVQMDMLLSEREDFYFGAKIVRGAYMDQERQRAKQLGHEDPINATYNDTTEMYHRVLRFILSQVSKRPLGRIAVMCATHNEDTVRHALHEMREWQLLPEQRVLCFGQLFGMCDHISFSLGQAGYSVYKYVPFGPVEEVLPYLSRRTLENSGSGATGVIGNSSRERKLLWTEFKRRLRTLDWVHRPRADQAVAVN